MTKNEQGTGAGSGVPDEPELAGMPEKLNRQVVRYSLERMEMVDTFDRLDVGSVITDLRPRHFEVRQVVHTVVDGIDVYTMKATEIV